MCHASEKSEVDPQKKIMALKTINLTFCRHISVDEVLYYTPHPTDPAKTLLKQEASVSVQGVPLSHYMEDMITSRISMNAGKGRQGLEWVINKINLEVNFRAIRSMQGNKFRTFAHPQVKSIAESVTRNTDDILSQTHKSFDGMTETARKSMDEISTAAKAKMGL